MLNNDRAQESLRDRNKREKLERIERAARRLFAERGFHKTTTRAIAQAAEIGTGTLFVYFPEKLDLLMHLFQQDLDRVTNTALDELPADLPLIESCRRVFNATYDFYARDENLARTFVKEMMFVDLDRQAELFRTSVRYINRLTELVESAKQRGDVRADVPAPLAAHHLFGTYYWGLTYWLSGLVDRRQLSMQLDMSLEMLMRGLKGGDDDGN